MSHVFVERYWDPPLGAAELQKMSEGAANCLEIHRVAWHGSRLSTDGRHLMCHFSGADVESVRNALRQSNAVADRVWAGTIHDAPGLTPADRRAANVLVSRQFAAPTTLEDIQSIEDAAAGCLKLHRVGFVRTFFSMDRSRMICLYRAPDAESVRIAQREAGMPVERVWAFRAFLPEDS